MVWGLVDAFFFSCHNSIGDWKNKTKHKTKRMTTPDYHRIERCVQKEIEETERYLSEYQIKVDRTLSNDLNIVFLQGNFPPLIMEWLNRHGWRYDPDKQRYISGDSIIYTKPITARVFRWWYLGRLCTGFGILLLLFTILSYVWSKIHKSMY